MSEPVLPGANGTTRRPFLSGRDIALIAVFAGITAALGLIPAFYTPFSPAPITAQSLGIALAGAVLGGKRGFFSQLLFVALVAIGLPLLAGGRGGFGVFFTATAGFIVGYVICAGLVGWATYRFANPYSIWKGIIVNLITGMFILYGFGIAGMMIVAKMGFTAAIVANAPFLPGDLLKMIVAALIAYGVHKSVPGLMPARSELARS